MTLLDEHRHRFTRAQFAALAAAGIDDWRCELIAGELVDVSPMSSRHAEVTRRLFSVLNRQLMEPAFVVGCQQPIGLGDWSEPEPDVWVARGRPGGYMDRHPEAADVLLVVEVGWSSIRFDRDIKLPMYAGAGVPEVWLFDVDAASVEVFRHPWATGYRSIETLGIEDVMTLPDGATFRIATILT